MPASSSIISSPSPSGPPLVLSLVPHIRPQLLDVFFTKNKNFDRKFTEFGGLRGGPDGDFVPTGETLAFILGGNDLAIRFGLAAALRRRPLLRPAQHPAADAQWATSR